MAGRSFFPEGELQKHGFSAPLISFLRDLAEFKDAVERIGSVESDIVTVAASKQPLDATLSALAGLNGTPGLVAQTGADTFTKRTLTAGTGMSVTNGDGVSGNPTVATTITQYTDEMARDAIGAALVAGSNVTITPNDGSDTITIAATGGGGSLSDGDYGDITVSGSGTVLTIDSGVIEERARDALGTALVAGSNITITPNDGADTITIAATGGGGGGSAWDFSPPSAASFSLASGDATNLTLTDDTDAGLLIDPGSPAAGQQVRAAYRTLTNKTLDWTLVVHLPHFKTSAGFGGWGAIAMDSTASNKAYLMGSHSDLAFAAFKFTDLTTHSSTVGSLGGAPGDKTEFFRIRKSGTTIFLEGAPSAKGPWVLLFSETDTTWLTNRADRVGIYAYYDRGTGSKMAAICPYFSLTGPGV